MNSNNLFFNLGKVIICTKYYSPDLFHERGSRETVRCVSLVEKSEGKHAQCLKVTLNANTIFAKLLWQQITTSRFFGVHLSSWLYSQLRSNTKRNGERTLIFTGNWQSLILHINTTAHLQCGKGNLELLFLTKSASRTTPKKYELLEWSQNLLMQIYSKEGKHQAFNGEV